MKRIITVFVLAVLGISAFAGAYKDSGKGNNASPLSADEPKAEIKFDKFVHDFGKFPESKSVVTCTFTFTNVGNAPLVITQCVASCGCTVPTYTDKPVAPGKTGQIKVTYNGKGRLTGQFKKLITVMSNAKNKLVRLCIQGEMTD